MSEIPKSALRDPSAWLAKKLDGHNAESRNSLLAQFDSDLKDLKVVLSTLELERKSNNRRIGENKKANLDASEYIQKTKELSKKIQQTEHEIIEVLNSALEEGQILDTSKTTENRAVKCAPAYFESACFAFAREDNSENSNLKSPDISLVSSDTDKIKYSEYVAGHTAQTSYHKYELGDLIYRTTRQRTEYLLATSSDGSVVGAMPVAILSTIAFGTYMTSMPWFNYGGPLAESMAIGDQLLRAATKLARESGCERAEFRETASRSNWPQQTHKVSMTLALPASSEAFDKALKSSLRAQSNKASRAGCSIHFGGLELLDEFYLVFSQRMRSLGTPIHSKAFYRALLETLDGNAFISVVKLESRPVAVGFLVAHGSTLEIPWASSLSKHNALGVNMFLYRSVLGWAADHGFEFFDFGRSTVNGPTYRFKKQWGATPQQLYWHSWFANESAQGLEPESMKFRIAIAIWKRLPVKLTVMLGPYLIRGLP